MAAAGKFESHAGGGDWALAAEVFRKYDADGSGLLDRWELMAALRECDLLSGCSATAAGRALADMDTNGDGEISFEEFREAFSRLARLRAAEQRQVRLRSARSGASAVPPNAAVDPRLRAAFLHFCSHGAARALTAAPAHPSAGSAASGAALTSRQWQRLLAAAGAPLESGALDVIFATHCAGRRGGRTLSFPRFLEALAQVAHESGLPLDSLLDSVRDTAPANAPGAPPCAGASAGAAGSPAKPPCSRSPCCASPRPKSAGKPMGRPATGKALHMAGVLPAGGIGAELAGPPASSAAGPPAPPLSKLQQRVTSLQQLLEDGLDGELDGAGIPAHPGASVAGAQQAQRAAQQAEHGDRLLVNPAFQAATTSEAGDLATFRLDLLSLLDQRCEAAERACAALVATRAELTKAAVAQCAAALGAAGAPGSAAGAEAGREALAAVRGMEEQLGETDGRLSAAVARVGQECRAAVSVVSAQVEALQKAHDLALKQTNEAILCIARRVGAMAGTQGQAQGQGQHS